jgi:protein SCO1/2
MTPRTTLPASWLLLLSLSLGACGGEAAGEPAPTGDDPAADPATAPASAPDEAPLPDEDMSLFQLELALEDQDGEAFRLEQLRGHPVLLTFFYASCTTMCPMIVSDARAVEAAVPEAARGDLRVVLVTIDPAHDTAARLRETATERGLPLDRWTLVRGSDADIRTLASTLGMNYRPTPDGFAHNAILTVLDAGGAVVAQSLGTGQPVEPLAGRIAEISAASSR